MQKRSEFLNKLKRPIPYYGSKEKIAPVIYDIIKKDGWTTQYIEPFVGSNSIILQDNFDGIKCIINDFDGKITNLWRALKYKPEETASYILGTCNTINLTGLDLAVQRSYDALLDRLHADIDFCDPKLAAHFMDLCCSWIGAGAGNTKGPWTTIKDEDGIDILVRKEKGDVACQQSLYTSDQGVRCNQAQYSDCGIRCQQSQYSGDQGVICKQAQYDDCGIRCNQAQYSDDRGIRSKQAQYTEWFNDISKRLSDSYILSHDFEKILNLHVISSKRTTIFFDPPYDKSGDTGGGVAYISDDHNIVSKRVREWCIKNNEALKNTRIIVAGRGKEHDELLNYGYEKIDGINIKSLNKNTNITHETKEFLWVKYNE